MAAQAPAADSPTVAATTLPDGWEAALHHRDRGARGEPDGFQRCGEAFLAIHLRAPDGPRASTALFNAAQCLEAAYLSPAATQAYERLLALYPQSEHAWKTREYLVEIYLAIARFDDAARHAERYAKLYPKDFRTEDMLRAAYRVRVGLGQKDRALAALDALEQGLRRDNPERAAQFFWMRRELLTHDDERLEHAMTYLERHGKTGGLDRRIVAEATVGQLLWRRACAKGLDFDLCAAVGRGPPEFSDQGRRSGSDRIVARRRPSSSPAPPPTCSELSITRGALFPRAQKDSVEAQRWFAEVLQGARRRIMIPEDASERRRAFADAVAMASVYIANRGFEELLAVLGEVSDAPDPGRLPELLARSQRLAGELEKQYAEVIAQKTSIVWSIAAAARIGQIAEFRGDALLRREVPRTHHDKTRSRVYCATMREQAAPFYKFADAAYERCLELSITSGTFTDFSRLCEEALNYRDPVGFPRTPEYINRPGLQWTRPIVVGVQLEPPPELATEPASTTP
ncbi:MAG: tetratricopeptide repeat protein [Nannocystis sp.]|nr:tetratricopeptide repeat protein [Nannocystis sp.]MBA3546970.1 tetratricopeptide repeat protein [Nannocystis sp.]